MLAFRVFVSFSGSERAVDVFGAGLGYFGDALDGGDDAGVAVAADDGGFGNVDGAPVFSILDVGGVFCADVIFSVFFF